MRVLAIVIPLTLTALVVGILWFAETYSNWRKTHEWQFPLQWNGFTKVIETEVISPISGVSVKTEQEIFSQYPLAPMLKTIYFLESTEGKNDGCREQGKFNGFGYAQSNHSWKCFDSFEDVVKAVNDWYVERLGVNGNDVVEALCFYNRGIQGMAECEYSKNFMIVIAKE